MNNAARKLVQLFSTTLLMTFIGVVSAANINTTIQEGRVNINRTFQCGDSNDNATYQSGQVNINHTIQACGGNRNSTGQFGQRNLNRTRQNQSVQQARNKQWKSEKGRKKNEAQRRSDGRDHSDD
jgi:hypothetical protein